MDIDWYNGAILFTESEKMANKTTNKLRERARQKKQDERSIQIIGGVVLVLIVAVLLWQIWPESEPEVLELPTGEVLQYDAPPPMTIDPGKKYFATFKMAKGGEFVAELFPDKAPVTVNNFVFLARQGYYDGSTFHRVLEGFMAQGGDPTGTGGGGPGYQFEDEFSDLTFDRPGLLAMANAGPNTNGSQFFITFVPTPHLNGLHTIFGQIIEGMDVVNNITRRDPNLNPDFPGDAIETITITEE
jgi:cyclophilin family peptidyl-prolyl cis-trans isomerase